VTSRAPGVSFVCICLFLEKNGRSLGVGVLGVFSLSIHAVPTQVLMMSFMLPLSAAIALSVRLGVLLPRNVARSKKVTVWTLFVCTILFGIHAYALYFFRMPIIRIFAYEPEVLDGCERIWWKVCTHYFLLSLFGVNTGVATGLGMQWTLGCVTFFFLWFFALPGTWNTCSHVELACSAIYLYEHCPVGCICSTRLVPDKQRD
jgi:Na+-driven multidrug efflux pump